mgnify:CR=1 FL=1
MNETENIILKTRKSLKIVAIEVLIGVFIIVLSYSLQIQGTDMILALVIATFFAINISGGYVYRVTQNEILSERFSLYTSLGNTMKIEDLEKVVLKQGVIGSLIDVGTVWFINAKEDSQNIKFMFIDNPKNVVDIVNDIIKESSTT